MHARHFLDANRVGPAHRGVVGRIAGTAPDYSYSPGLEEWLANPQAMIKSAYRLPPR